MSYGLVKGYKIEIKTVAILVLFILIFMAGYFSNQDFTVRASNDSNKDEIITSIVNYERVTTSTSPEFTSEAVVEEIPVNKTEVVEPLVEKKADIVGTSNESPVKVVVVEEAVVSESAVQEVVVAEEKAKEEILESNHSIYNDGIFTGTAEAFRGDMTVQVDIEDGIIKSVEVVNHSDDRRWFNRAIGVINTIISTQSAEVDTVTGATYSSKGIINGTKEALDSALK
jgi:uncharacterized protein with FMN-binding domain